MSCYHPKHRKQAAARAVEEALIGTRTTIMHSGSQQAGHSQEALEAEVMRALNQQRQARGG